MSEMPRWRRSPDDDWQEWPPSEDAEMVWLEMGTPEQRPYIRFSVSESMEKFKREATRRTL